MKKKTAKPKPKRGAASLRKRAQQTLQARKTPKDSSKLVHELEVHRVELEIQNEELRGVRESIEIALEGFREVFDFAPVGYVVLAADGTIREINVAAAQLLAEPRGGVIGVPFARFVSQGAIHSYDVLVTSAREKSSPMTCELELRRAGGTFRARLTVAALPRAKTLLVTFDDISERKAKEIALLDTQRALREANRRKDDFLAMLSHELRNPLSPIRTSISVLQLAPEGSAAARAALDIIDRSTAHLTRLVQDLLDVTRVERGKIELHPEPLDLARLVRRTVSDHRSEFALRNISLDVRCDVAEAWVVGDEARLVQVVSNLLVNAEKFTPGGGSVLVAVEEADGMIKVRVSDTGIGIPPDMIDQLFQPFAQGAQSLDRSRGGLGLGLAMVKSLVELQGGRVGIASPGLDRGTEAWFALPRRTGAAPAEVRRRDLTRAPRRVLIIEDKLDTASSLRSALLLHGHDVAVAHDGAAGLALAETFQPEVVLCDLGLPDMDGFQVARSLRGRDMYLVALTGYAMPDDIARTRAAGFARHLAKPATIEQIEQILEAAPSSAASRNNVLH